jgi:histidyl-tRNA synthetase
MRFGFNKKTIFAAMNQVSIPKGTRDFSPEVVRKRNYIIQVIRKTFELYGFEPLETPAMENMETLTGKYGDEGDKLMFKILNNGEIFEKAQASTSNKDLINAVSEKALRYDLTIPFARYVAMNRGTISFPFKRYQIQPVWRADRPQKGRFREFYQCDADVVGSNALLNEVELLNIYTTVFNQLGIEVELRINNRKILAGLAEWMQVSERLTELTISIDKLDKIGLDGVKTELQKNNFTENQIEKLQQFLNITGTTEEKLIQLNNIFIDTEIAKKGISELEEVLNKSAICNLQSAITIDTTLARGLNYYTGIIIEVKAKNVQMGSIGGGGRYDDLTGVFGLPNMSGVGISFGLDRIYEVIDELKLFPDNLKSSTQVLFINFGNEAEQFAFNLLQKVRAKNIAAEIYPSAEKVKKQMEYANKKQIAYVVLIGDEEMKAGKFAVKNMQTGNQQLCTEAELLEIAF